VHGQELGSVEDLVAGDDECETLGFDTDTGAVRCGGVYGDVYTGRVPFLVYRQSGAPTPADTVGVFILRSLRMHEDARVVIFGSRPAILVLQDSLLLESGSVEVTAGGWPGPSWLDGPARGNGPGGGGFVTYREVGNHTSGAGGSFCSEGGLGAFPTAWRIQRGNERCEWVWRWWRRRWCSSGCRRQSHRDPVRRNHRGEGRRWVRGHDLPRGLRRRQRRSDSPGGTGGQCWRSPRRWRRLGRRLWRRRTRGVGHHGSGARNVNDFSPAHRRRRWWIRPNPHQHGGWRRRHQARRGHLPCTVSRVYDHRHIVAANRPGAAPDVSGGRLVGDDLRRLHRANVLL